MTTTGSSGQAALSWLAISGATSYNLYRSTTAGSEGAIPWRTGVSGNTFSDTGVINGSVYYYQVTAVGLNSESNRSNEGVATPLATPVLTVAAGNAQTALSWSNIAGAVSYTLYRATTAGGEGSYAYKTGLTGTGYTDTGLANGTTYFYQLTAVAPNSQSGRSVEVKAKPGVQQAAPTGLIATAGNGQTLLSWTAPVGAVSYNLYRSTTSGGEGNVPIKTGVVTTTYSDTGLTNGQGYFYQVTALGASATESVHSNEAAATPQAVPPAPLGLTATPGNTQIVLAWSAVSGAPSYHVQRALVSGGPYTVVASPVSAGYTDTALVNGTAYYYVVTAVNTNGDSLPSNEATATPQTALLAPSGLAASPGNGEVLLSWNLSVGAAVYRLGRATVSGGPYTTVATLSGTRAVDTGLVNGTTYYYIVTAVGPVGQTSASSEVAATPQALAVGLRINSGGSSYTDSSAHTWTADQGFTGGSVITTASAVTGTSDPALYQTQRTGATFRYAIPLSNGTYLVSLLFAEIEGNAAGQRFFSVSANGQSLLNNYDIAADAGAQNRAVVKTFPVTVATGQLALTFTGITGTASVAAISCTLSPGTVIVDAAAPPWAEDVVPFDDGVNLASGAEESAPGPDIEAFNPVGPSVAFERLYRSKWAARGYGSPGLSAGWVHNYDLTVQGLQTSTWGPLTLIYPSGATEVWTPVLNNGSPTGVLMPPTIGAPYLVQGIPSTTAGQWQSLTITFADRSTNSFTPSTSDPNHYLLTAMTQIAGPAIAAGRSVTASYDATNRLQALLSDAGATLLQFSYDGNGNLASVQDLASSNVADHRQVTYTFGSASDPPLAGTPLLTAVSQIGVSAPQWQYDYLAVSGKPFLQTTQQPNPAGGGLSTDTTVYDPASGRVAVHRDANLAERRYGYQGSSTTVGVYDPTGALAGQWTQNLTNGPVGANGPLPLDGGMTDASGNTATTAYTDSQNPLLPTQVTNRNSQSTQLTYDPSHPYGNLQQITGSTRYHSPIHLRLLGDYWLCTGSTQVHADEHKWREPGSDHLRLLPEWPRQRHLLPHARQRRGGAAERPTILYDDLGNVTQVTGPGNNAASTIKVSYDYTNGYGGYTQGEVLGEPTTVTVTGVGKADTAITYYQYDGRGNRTAIIDALGNETDFTYMPSDQLASVIYPATGSGRAHTDYTYLYPGGPLTQTCVYDETNTLFRQVIYAYGNEGELKAVTGSVQPVSYGYDALYRVTTLTDGNAQTTHYDYDPVGNLIGVRYPNQSGAFDALHYVYDSDGNLIQRLDGNNVETDYQYNDPASLLTGIHYPGGQDADKTFHYDPYGRLQMVADGTGSQTLSYDDLGNPLSVLRSFTGGPQGQQIGYGYYPDGSRSLMTTPLGQFGYQYDGVGRLTQTTFPWIGGYVSHTYLPNGWLKRTQGPRTQTLYSYNPRGFVTGLQNFSVPGNMLLSAFTQMTYDAVGNRLGVTVGLPTQGNAPDGSRALIYAYDNRNELTGEQSTSANHYNDTYSFGFGYDNAENPTTLRGSGTPGYNLDNQFLGTGFVYDGNGNPTSYLGQSSSAALSFDPENHLLSIASRGFAASYGADDLRASKSGASGKTFFLYDGTTPVVEEGVDGSLVAANGWAADGWRSRFYPSGSPVATQAGATNGFYDAYSYDPSGNRVQRHRQTGAWAAQDTVVYDAFGQWRADVDTGTGQAETYSDPVGFGGQFGYYTDSETGLSLLGHRYYDGARGRFVTRDPSGYGGGINLYGYTGNNPVNENDPSGFDPDERTGFIDTDRVRFSQNGYSENFGPKSPSPTVTHLANGLKSGAIDPNNVEPIRLVKFQGNIYTLDNRRLLAFHMAKKDAPYRWATREEIDEKWEDHFTTKNGGSFIERNSEIKAKMGVLDRFGEFADGLSKGANALGTVLFFEKEYGEFDWALSKGTPADYARYRRFLYITNPRKLQSMPSLHQYEQGGA